MSVHVAHHGDAAPGGPADGTQTRFAPVDSAWTRTSRGGTDLPRLSQDRTTAVVILGAGSTGLTTAHFLAEAGVDCVVLEAASPGWGCSGRSGGMVVARYKRGYAYLAKRYGHDVTRLLHRMIVGGIDQIQSIIEKYGIECDFRRCGHLTAAHSPKALRSLEDDIAWLRSEAADRTPEMLGAGEVSSGLGTNAYVGGYLDKRTGAIHQLDYTRGLARGLLKRGVSIFANSPARAFSTDAGGVSISTEGGTIRARQLVVATNAYTSLGPRILDLDRRIVPVCSSLFATERLAPELMRTVMPAGWVVGDTKHLMNSFALLPSGSMLYGGRGDITGRTDSPESYRSLERLFIRTFPQLAGIRIAVRWSGMVAVTLDDFPHVGREGAIHWAIGCGGRGIVLSGVMGRALAGFLTGGSVDLGPITRNPFKAIPLHRWRVPGMKIAATYYRARDLIGV